MMGFLESLIPAELRRGIVVPHPEHGNIFIRVTISDRGVDITVDNEAGVTAKGFCTDLALASNRHNPNRFLVETIKNVSGRLAQPKVWSAEWCEMDSWKYR